MKGLLTTVSTLIAVLAVPVLVFVALDYANHLRYATEAKRISDEWQRSEDLTLLKICGSFREFQKSPEGKDTHAMDDICNDVETRMYPWVVPPAKKG